MSGFVAAYREALDHPLFFGNSERLGAWMWLVMRAAWKPTPYDIGGKIITIERGQLCTSRAQLSKAWGMSPSGVERFLNRLKTEQMIEQATGQGKSVITICNYSKYQDVSDEAGQGIEVQSGRTGGRTKTGQAFGQVTGQANSEISNGNTKEIPFDFDEAGQATGQATGQQSDSHRTTKEQGNKGTRDKDDKSSFVISDNDHAETPSSALPKIQSSEIEQAVECWNMAAAKTGWPAIRALSPDRSKKLSARLKENGLDGWKDALRRAMRSEQLGRDPPGWFSFPWLIANTNNILKVLEGNYDKRFGTSGGNGISSHQSDTGPINPMAQAVLARQARRTGEQQRQPERDAGNWAGEREDTQVLL